MSDLTGQKYLQRVFDADEQLREAEQAFLDLPDDAAEAALVKAVAAELAEPESEEQAHRLVRLTELCAEQTGGWVPGALLDVLNHPEPGVRVVAGEALLERGYERYAEVARAIEQRVAEGSEGAALSELPWILAEIGEPSALKLIRPMLKHTNAEVAASAIEAIAQLGDPAAIDELEALAGDTRRIALDDSEETADGGTVGELASEAASALRSAKNAEGLI